MGAVMKAELWSSLKPLMKLPNGHNHDWTTSTFCDGRTVEKADWQQVGCMNIAARMHEACHRHRHYIVTTQSSLEPFSQPWMPTVEKRKDYRCFTAEAGTWDSRLGRYLRSTPLATQSVAEHGGLASHGAAP